MKVILKQKNKRAWQVYDENGNFLRCECGRGILAVLEDEPQKGNFTPCSKIKIKQS